MIYPTLSYPTLLITVCDHSSIDSLNQALAEMVSYHQQHQQHQNHPQPHQSSLIEQLCPLPLGSEMGVVQVGTPPLGSGTNTSTADGGIGNPLHVTAVLSMYHTEVSKLLVDASEFLMSSVLRDPSPIKAHMMQSSFRALTRRYHHHYYTAPYHNTPTITTTIITTPSPYPYISVSPYPYIPLITVIARYPLTDPQTDCSPTVP